MCAKTNKLYQVTTNILSPKKWHGKSLCINNQIKTCIKLRNTDSKLKFHCEISDETKTPPKFFQLKISKSDRVFISKLELVHISLNKNINNTLPQEV